MLEVQILEELTDLFRDVFDDDALVISRETTAADVPDWDSLTHVALTVHTERHFGIKFQTAETEQLKNVGDFVDLISSKLKTAGRA